MRYGLDLKILVREISVLNPYKICGGQSGTPAFRLLLLVFPVDIIPPVLRTHDAFARRAKGQSLGTF